MRLQLRLAVLASCVATLCIAGTASAGGMDPTPERFVLQPPNLPGGATSCQQVAGNPELAVAAGGLPNQFACRPDNAAYQNMMAELGFAIAPTAFRPARTTGIGGFALTLEANFTKINADGVTTGANGSTRSYWKDGTQGAIDPNTKNFSIVNNSPDSILQLYAMKARKGLPLGFEVTGSLGFIANTTLWVGGADIRWALLEGFRTGFLGYLPDVSIGGGVRTTTGTSKFFLTTVGIDVSLSKPIPLADSAVLTPYVGYQRLLVFADSTIIDTTPNVDAIQQCGFNGTRINETDPNANNGAPVCQNKLSNGAENNGDFNNNVTFDKVRVHRHRGIAGLAYRYEVLYMAGQFATDITEPNKENPTLVGGRQWTLSLEGGVFF